MIHRVQHVSHLILFGCVAALLAAGGGRAAQLSVSLDFRDEDILYGRSHGYDVVRVSGWDLTDEVGAPQLPARLVHVVLPSGSRVTAVEIVEAQGEEIPGEFSIHPAQNPEILPTPGVAMKRKQFVEPLSAVYESQEPYPGRLVELVKTGNVGRHRVASLLIYPFQYLPSERRLVYYSRIQFRLSYESLRAPFLEGGSDEIVEILKGLVVNSGDLQAEKGLSGDCEYVIITSAPYASTFQPLADWKTEKGTPARVVTTDSIYQNFSGSDEAEKIRNFIKYAYQQMGTQWVLLGGDTDVVPDRVAYAMTCEAGYPGEDDLRADLYYSDLDGTWNLNGNGVYGEMADSVDLYPEVFVGRAPVNSLQEVNTFVSKVLRYQKNPPRDYQLDVLFLGEILWRNPYTDGGVGKDLIDELYVPPRFDPILKLYERNGNENYTTVMWALNQGQNLINHDGHGWYNYMGVGEGGLDPSDMDELINGYQLGIVYSLGCWVGAFHYDAISEHFINNPLGGGVGFIANSSYGWGSPGNPAFGYSDRFDATFYEKLLSEGVNRIGATLGLCKAHYAPRSEAENVYRWHQYQLNLLGDPEMPIWTDIPSQLLVTHPESISVGATSLGIAIESDGPVEGALVCIHKDSEVYERGYTDGAGNVVLDVSVQTPGVLMLTVTGKDRYPYQDSILVYSSGAYVGYRGHRLNGGNGDQEMNPGEVLDIAVTLQNWGAGIAGDVSAVLSSSDPLVNVTDSVHEFGTLQPADTATGMYSFSVSSQAQNGHTIFFTLRIRESAHEWQGRFGIVAAAGNGNGVAEPGESLSVHIWSRNEGLGLARMVTGRIQSTDPYVSLIDSVCDFGDIGSYSTGVGDFAFVVDEHCPTPRFAGLTLLASTSDGYAFADSLLLTIGVAEFADDMEAGTGQWSHGGSLDMWRRTGQRAHSGGYSWYCGDTSYVYHNAMNCYLQSAPIVVTPDNVLSFWHWYDVTIYGVDGLYVEIIHDGISDTLDFIGSGGALDSLLIGNPWLETVYDLSVYPVGDTIRVRFRFVSDGFDVAEGFYIDDVRVGPASHSTPSAPVLLYPPDSAVANDATPTLRWLSHAGPDEYYTLQYSCDESFVGEVTTVDRLMSPMYTVPVAAQLEDDLYYWRVKVTDEYGMESEYQVPFCFTVSAGVGDIDGPIVYNQLPRGGRVTLTVYDMMGRVIRTLVDGHKDPGRHTITWSGESDSGEPVGVGVYFCTLHVGDYTKVRKLVLLK